MLFPLWWILFIIYCIGKVPGSKSEKSSYESNLLQTVSKNGQEVLISLRQLEMPPAVPPSYLWHVEWVLF